MSEPLNDTAPRDAELRAELDAVEKALAIGAVSYDGDSWFAAHAGYGYDEAEEDMAAGHAALAKLRRALAEPPPGTRLVLATEILMGALASYTEDGRRITFEWGEPDEHGWYAPTFTVATAAPPAVDVERLREAAEDAIQCNVLPANIHRLLLAALSPTGDET